MDFEYPDTPQEQPKKKVKVTGKKRKIEDGEDNKDDLRSKARAYCKTPHEWQDVSKMNNKALKNFVDTKEFENDSALRSSVFDGLHQFYAFVVDKLTMSNGYVKDQIIRDLSLRTAIENEAVPLFQYLNNKVKIGVLTGNNVVQGKLKQKLQEPVIEEIFPLEETNEQGNDSSETDFNMGEATISDMGAGTTREEKEQRNEDGADMQIQGIDQ